MSLAALAVRNQRRRANFQYHQQAEPLQPSQSLDQVESNLKNRKVGITSTHAFAPSSDVSNR